MSDLTCNKSKLAKKDIYFLISDKISKEAVREKEAFCVHHLDIIRKAAFFLCF